MSPYLNKNDEIFKHCIDVLLAFFVVILSLKFNINKKIILSSQKKRKKHFGISLDLISSDIFTATIEKYINICMNTMYW